METFVILTLTVAVAAAVVWWGTSVLAEGRDWWPWRRQGGGESTALEGEANEYEVTTGRHRRHGVPPRSSRHRAERAWEDALPVVPTPTSFSYLPDQVADERPPLLLSLLRLVLAIAFVAALFAGGIWFVGHFINEQIARLVGQ